MNEAREFAEQGPLTELAARLSRAFAQTARAPANAPRLVDDVAIARTLQRAVRRFRDTVDATPSQRKAAEWLLDNYYLCERALRRVRLDLPVGFRRRLPLVAAHNEPRILLLGRALVHATALELDASLLEGFVRELQRTTALTVAELWAWPAVLRATVLEALSAAVGSLLGEPPNAGEKASSAPRDRAVEVERSIRALRLLSEMDWKDFFQTTSAVEAILRADPARFYDRSDFETRDACRKVVEEVAWSTHLTEPEVARRAIALATPHGDDVVRGHVGYYLVGDGRRELDRSTGYRPSALRPRVARALRRCPTLTYVGVIGVMTLLLLAAMGWVVAGLVGASGWILVVLGLVPASSAATVTAHQLLTRALSPRTLPKLDLSKGIPAAYRTAIVIPALIEKEDDVDDLLSQLEVHFLTHPEPSLCFALLLDHTDSKGLPEDRELLAHARHRLEALNRAHGRGQDHPAPFHLLYRTSRWNPAEERYMGWERKRGKLEEWNRFLRGDKTTSFTHHFGAPEGLQGIRYVITLDADTQLPLGAAQRLVGLMAHPLNRPVFDATSGRVTSGYTVVQPRVESTPLGGPSSYFARVRAGDTAIDIYTNAVSDVYQDLFGAGIYVGKGIYDVDAFARSLEGRVPENMLVSHDLFEGSHGRAGLATDVVLLEEYPGHYLAFSRRMHRWIRGDWQLLPWLFGRVPGRHGATRNVLSFIDRYKIADNLRRSLLAPSVVTLFFASLLVLPARAAPLALVPVLAPLVLVLLALRGGGLREALGRYAIYALSLPHEAWVVSDAILRVAVRAFTGKHRLEWVTAARTAVSVKEGRGAWPFYREMLGSLGATLLGLGAVAAVRPSALWVASPVAFAWGLAPLLLSRASQVPARREPLLTASHRRTLGRLARRTWYFFESFVGPLDQWLPPDNFQAHPRAVVAHRTSPTNIGLLLVGQMSAHDFGYIGPKELCLLLAQSFGSLLRLERYQGHWLNWYSTKDLAPLLPRYVSTVDSGNLAASLIALSAGCAEVPGAPIAGERRRQGLRDTLAVFDEALTGVGGADRTLRREIDACAAVIEEVRGAGASAAVTRLLEGALPRLSAAILSMLESDTAHLHTERLKEGRVWLERLVKQARSLLHDLELFFAWATLARAAPELAPQLCVSIAPDAEDVLSLRDVATAAMEFAARVRAAPPFAPAASADWARQAMAAAAAAEQAASDLISELLALGEHARAEVSAMDYRFLYDDKRRLFHTGYNVTAATLDPSYYDLLASEARVASFIAIMEHQVPVRHWFTLGRPVTRQQGGVALLSWGATMFEYLLPNVFMRSQPRTLLAESARIAVARQIEYGKECGCPWGISESSFAQLDAHDVYQYRSFGVPGLGLKRGLEDDLVVAPYASLLALGIRPRDVMRNLARLRAMRVVGTYGLFEAIDYRSPGTADRQAGPEGEEGFTVVRSHMAHHQGMILACINNALHDDVLVDRFHRDPQVHTTELLLNERVPWKIVEEDAVAVTGARQDPQPLHVPSYPAWSPEVGGVTPEVLVLSNGRLTTLLTDAGAGELRHRGLAVTTPYNDPTRDAQGTWIYVRDEASGEVWSAVPAPTRAANPGSHVSFAAHRAEMHERYGGISMRTEVSLSQLHDVEVRHVTLHNEGGEARTLTLSSFLEPVLEARDAALRHPAFSRMFVECDVLPQMQGAVCERRKKRPEDDTLALLHRVVFEGSDVRYLATGTDRAAFLGRLGDARSPALEQRSHSGSSLEPGVSVSVQATLAPGAAVEIAWITAVAQDRAAAIALGRRFGTMHAARWVAKDAERARARRLRATGVPPEELPLTSRLLSRVLVPAPFHGARAETRRALSPAQKQLWGHGVSGDDPIVVVHVADPDATPLARQVLAAYRLARASGVSMELVFLDDNPSGYQTDQAGQVRAFLVREDVARHLHQRGGIFVIAKDRMAHDEVGRLEAAAAVVLDASRGDLAAQWARMPALPAPLPRFAGSRAEGVERADGAEAATLQGSPSAPSQPQGLAFGHRWGGFSEDGRHYVIPAHRPSPTPSPWCNVLANGEFGCLVSESALGATYAQNSGEHRLTPWRNDPTSDTPSEVVYLRDEETAAVWSSTPLPAAKSLPVGVRHGAGYTVYQQTSHGLEQELTVYVASDSPVKYLRLRVRDVWNRPRRLTVTHYVEWLLGVARRDASTNVLTEIDAGAGCILARSAYDASFSERVAFMTCDRAIHGATCDRTEFLGRGGDYERPAALRRWGLAGTTEPGVDPCGALQTHVDLAAGGETTVTFALGEGASRAEAMSLVAAVRESGRADRELARAQARWDALLSTVAVKTPDPAMDLVLNRFYLYQALASRWFARSGFYQSSGAFGFRDQLQDVMAFTGPAPELTRAHILECAAHQFEEGDVLHWWHPPSGAGVRTRCSDDFLWLPYVTAHYVDRTGDVAILDEPVPFLTASPLRPDEDDRYAEFPISPTRATLLEHCRRAIVHGYTEGPHGLPLIGAGDWNDGMNRVGARGRGESVWLAWFLHAATRAFVSLAQRARPAEDVRPLLERAERLRENTEAVAWDGQWYLRGFFDDGTPLGSSSSRECQIDSIAQSWAVLSGAADADRARRALEMADARLIREQERLVLLLTPPFDRTEEDPGYIKAYPPGVRENGGQYTHAATWLGFAHVASRDGDGAARIFAMLNPIVHASDTAGVERYRVEPYVLAGDVHMAPGAEGRGGWTWYTGAAAWAYRLGVEGILGIVRVPGGLRVDPCIPRAWPGFEATVRVGRKRVHVQVENAARTGRGVSALTIDGRTSPGNTVIVPRDDVEEDVHVRVVLGERPEPALDAPRDDLRAAGSG